MTDTVSRTTKQQEGMPGVPGRALGRSMLLVAAALAVGVALVVVLGVIPPVRDIWVPHAAGAELAVPAFWASALANLVFAAATSTAAIFGGMRYRSVCWVLIILAAGALLQALMYLDAVASFHGLLQAQMQTIMTRLRYAVVADAVAGLLVLVSTVAALRAMRVRDSKPHPV